jgi:hypothetical protein
MSKKAWASMNGEHVADLTARSLAATGKKTAAHTFSETEKKNVCCFLKLLSVLT